MSRENSFAVSAKYRYIRRLLRHRWQGQPRACPYCGPSSIVKLVRRKKLIVEILVCQTCHLWFRWPADSSREHDDYYQNEFADDSPQVILPNPGELDALKRACFTGSALDINNKVEVLRALRPGGTVLDFGCSWGYGTYQLKQRGFDAVGFEISKPRAEFGRANLDLQILDSFDQVEKWESNKFDIIFSNHVVEHLPDIAPVFALLARLLKPGGFIFHVLPNFTGKKARSGYWIKWIGEDHPIAPAIPFFEFAVPRSGLTDLRFGSNPFDAQMAKALASPVHSSSQTEGDELLVYARKEIA